jgi:hypothetical protein
VFVAGEEEGEVGVVLRLVALSLLHGALVRRHQQQRSRHASPAHAAPSHAHTPNKTPQDRNNSADTTADAADAPDAPPTPPTRARPPAPLNKRPRVRRV